MTDSSAADRRARWAVAAVFLANGVMIGSWAAHIPLAKERLDIGHAALGLALLAMAGGALISMPLTGAMIAKLGSAAVTRASTVALCLTFPLPVMAPDPLMLAAGLLAFGAANGMMDVAMNAHGVAVERRLTRPVMSSYHGMYSLGALAGAALASLLLGYLPPVAHAVLLAAVGLAIAVFALPHLLPAGVDLRAGGPAFALPGRASLALGVLTFLAMTAEGAVLDWGALHLRGAFSIGPEYAAIGFAAFSATMAAGRFSGDWMRSHFGPVTLVRASAFLAAGGLGLALVAPSPAVAVAGFAMVGGGLANLVPVFFGAAGALPDHSSGSGIAAVATLGYLGFLAGPPLIGLAAEATSLQMALGSMVLACLLIGFTAAAASPAARPATAAAPA